MELLVRVVDKDQPDPELAKLCSKRGDVICACPDGWNWSVAERTADYWRIISSPVLDTYVNLVLNTATRLDGTLLARRSYSLDFSQLSKPSLYQGKRTRDIISETRLDMVKAAFPKIFT